MSYESSRPLLIVVAAVVLRDRRVLLTRRRPGAHLGGSWEFPGGKVEPGEVPRAALEREIREELGIAATVGEPFAFNDHAYPDRHVLLLTYVTEVIGTPRPLGCDDIGWFTASDVGGLIMPPADTPVIEKLLTRLS